MNRDRGNRGFNRPNRSEMFDAVCAKCGNACQVPFRPNGKKDVLCSNCFKAGQGDSDGRREHREFRERRPFSPMGSANNVNFDQINSKLDRILALLEK